jgi:hypothetical protein
MAKIKRFKPKVTRMDSNLEIELLKDIVVKRVTKIDIEKAARILTAPQFKIWIRLHSLTDSELSVGIFGMSRIMKVEVVNLRKTLEALQRAGFVFIDCKGKGRRSKVRLARLCKISGNNKFVKF